jgi:hypothetical protein
MTEDPIIVKMNIAHYLAMLKLDMADDNRLVIERLLAEAREDLERAASYFAAGPTPPGIGPYRRDVLDAPTFSRPAPGSRQSSP